MKPRRLQKREVTERDFRRAEFRDADPSDYEFRADGQLVRKDRWETGIHRIRAALGDYRREFEVDDVVAAVGALVAALPTLEDEIDAADADRADEP